MVGLMIMWRTLAGMYCVSKRWSSLAPDSFLFKLGGGGWREDVNVVDPAGVFGLIMLTTVVCMCSGGS